jgi:hypothetical protein
MPPRANWKGAPATKHLRSACRPGNQFEDTVYLSAREVADASESHYKPRATPAQLGDIRRDPSRYHRFRKVFIMIFVVGQMFARNSKPKLWLFVLYLFDPKFLKMASGTHNVATNKINRSHCADRTRW